MLLSCLGLFSVALKKFSIESVFVGVLVLTLAVAAAEAIMPDSGDEPHSFNDPY